jgi:hypothetical protein
MSHYHSIAQYWACYGIQHMVRMHQWFDTRDPRNYWTVPRS